MKNKIWILFICIIISILIYLAFRPRAIGVEMAKVTLGTFSKTLSSECYFRAIDRYTLTSFADGEMKLIRLKAGEKIKAHAKITELFWDDRFVPIQSPTAGVISKVFRENAGPIRRGDPLVEIVDPSHLEIVCEILTSEAVKIKIGDSAILSNWGEDKEMRARVQKISQSAFIKLSPLGVEEERTEVILDAQDKMNWEKEKVGHLYHVEARIILSVLKNVLKIPTGALLHDATGWRVFLVKEGRAKLSNVEVESVGSDESVIKKLSPGEIVINYPGDKLKDGSKVYRQN